MRQEFQKTVEDYRVQNSEKSAELSSLQNKMKEVDSSFKKDKSQLQETLSKDKYQTDLYAKENENLRQAKVDLEQERDQLYNDIRNLEAENERSFQNSKDLRKKVKKLETILYGRK